jgi:ABC transporter substrate binding protein
MVRDRPDAILMVTDALTALNRKRVFEFAAQQKLPAIYEYDFLVSDGGLMSYGPDMHEVYDRAADLADRILKGARPADLPFEQPTHFRLGANFLAVKKSDRRPPIDVGPITLPRSPASLSSGNEVAHMFTRKPHPRLEEFAISGAKRLLQQNLPTADSCTAAKYVLYSRPHRQARAARLAV